MSEHRIGTREEWQAARDELLQAENEHAERSEELAKRRRELPWVPVEKEYSFDTDEGTKTLAELFDGRSQLLAYNICSAPTTPSGPARAARTWPITWTRRSSTSTTGT